MAAEDANLIPGGAFEDEVFAEGVFANEYESGEAFNDGTWTAAFSADAGGSLLISKVTAGNIVALRRGTSGATNMRSAVFQLTRGQNYTLTYKARCTSSSGMVIQTTLEEYADAAGTEKIEDHALFDEKLSGWTDMQHGICLEGEGLAYVRLYFNIENTSRTLEIQWIRLIEGTPSAEPPADDDKEDEEELDPYRNLLPGGSFESEVYDGEATVNEYASGVAFNGGTWTGSFDPTYGSYLKLSGKTGAASMVELKRGTKEGGGASISAKAFPITFGKTYKLSYDIRCTSSSGAGISVSLPVYENGTSYVTSHPIYSGWYYQQYKHVEHYFMMPTGRKDATHMSILFSIGSTSKVMELKNISLTLCDTPVAGYTDAAAVESETYNSIQFCTSDSYDSLNIHTIISAASSKMLAGTEVTMYQTAAIKGAEGDGAYTAIVAQYDKDNVLCGLDVVSVSAATQAGERDYLCGIAPQKVKLYDNAVSYKVFYRGTGDFVAPLRKAGKGTIEVPAAPAA